MKIVVLRHVLQFGVEQIFVGPIVRSNQAGVMFDPVGDLARIGDDDPLLLGFIVSGDDGRVGNGGLDPRREPLLHPDIEGHCGKDRNQNGWRYCDHREHCDQPGMQTRTRRTRSPLNPQTRQPPGDQRPHCEHNCEIDDQKSEQYAMIGLVGDKARDGGVGDYDRCNCEQTHDHGQSR